MITVLMNHVKKGADGFCSCDGAIRYGWKNNWTAWFQFPNKNLPCTRPNGGNTEKCQCSESGIPTPPIPPVDPSGKGPNTNNDNRPHESCKKGEDGFCSCDGAIRYGWKNNWTAWFEYPGRKLPCTRTNGENTEKCQCNASGIPEPWTPPIPPVNRCGKGPNTNDDDRPYESCKKEEDGFCSCD